MEVCWGRGVCSLKYLIWPRNGTFFFIGERKQNGIFGVTMEKKYHCLDRCL